MKNVLVISAGLLAGLSGIRVAAAAPAWCSGLSGGDTYDLAMLSRADADIEDIVKVLVLASCVPNDEAKRAAGDIDKARAAYGRKLGMVDGDWADAVAYVKNHDRDVKVQVSTKNYAQTSPLDQFALLADGTVYGDEFYGGDVFESNLTATGRLALVSSCMRSAALANQVEAPRMAICETDIKRFDPAKVATEIKGDTAHDGTQRMFVRFVGYGVASQLKKHADDVAAVQKKDPAFKKMFDIAEQSRADWQSSVGTRADLLALVQSMESATHFKLRSGFADCEAKTDAALKDAASKLPAKSFDKMWDVKDDPGLGFGSKAAGVFASNPILHLAAEAYVLCDPGAALSDYFTMALMERPGARGPRVAGLAAIENAKLLPDDMSVIVLYPHFDARPYKYSHGAYSTWGGVIKSIKPGKDTITVEFVKETIKQSECVSEHPSKKIDHVSSSGQFVYEMDCEKSQMVTIDRTPPTKLIEAGFAKVLKVGERVSVTYNTSDEMQGIGKDRGLHVSPGGHGMETDVGAILATWANKTATVPNSLLGAPVK